MQNEFFNKSDNKWKAKSGWYADEQEVYRAGMNEAYDKMREKYGEKLFEQLAGDKRLNNRLYAPKTDSELDMSHVAEMKKCKTFNSMYGRLPPNKYEASVRDNNYKIKIDLSKQTASAESSA